jgi:hypothetical protein
MDLKDLRRGKPAHQGFTHLGRIGPGLGGEQQSLGFVGRNIFPSDPSLVADVFEEIELELKMIFTFFCYDQFASFHYDQ